MKKLVKPFTGIPAPKVLSDDPWFGPVPPLTVTQEEYLAMRTQLEMENLLIPSTEDVPQVKEVENIHEVMYDIATKNQSKSPVFGHGWMSGTGL